MASLRTRARRDARLKFAPEASALHSLIRDARHQLRNDITTQAGAAEGISAAIDAARPEVRKVYRDAGVDARHVDTQINQDLRALGGAADQFKAAHDVESGGAKRRLSEALAQTDQEFQMRKVQAREGALFGINNARRRFAQTEDTYGTRLSQIGRERGAYAVSRLQEYQDAQAKADADANRLAETVRHNQAGENIARRRNRIAIQSNRLKRQSAARKGKPRAMLSLDRSLSFVSQVDEAATHIQQLKQAKWSPAKIRDALRVGQQFRVPIRGQTDSQGNPKTEVIKLPKLNSAAIDIAFNVATGPLQESGIKQLKRIGVQPRAIPREWKPRGVGRTGKFPGGGF